MNVRWGEMMRRAALFGVEPAAFWRLSLKEWRWLTGGDEMSAMTGVELERLAERWPDELEAAQTGPGRAPSTLLRPAGYGRSPSPARVGGSQ